MKLIDVLEKLSKGEIKQGTLLTINDRKKYRQYKYIGNCFLDDYNLPLNVYGESDLNSEVTFIEPEHKKYYLRLYGCDDKDTTDYINMVDGFGNFEDFEEFEYVIDNKYKDELYTFKTKFTQEEIDANKFLKFVETHGVKEEVKDDEVN